MIILENFGYSAQQAHASNWPGSVIAFNPADAPRIQAQGSEPLLMVLNYETISIDYTWDILHGAGNWSKAWLLQHPDEAAFALPIRKHLAYHLGDSTRWTEVSAPVPPMANSTQECLNQDMALALLRKFLPLLRLLEAPVLSEREEREVL